MKINPLDFLYHFIRNITKKTVRDVSEYAAATFIALYFYLALLAGIAFIFRANFIGVLEKIYIPVLILVWSIVTYYFVWTKRYKMIDKVLKVKYPRNSVLLRAYPETS